MRFSLLLVSVIGLLTLVASSSQAQEIILWKAQNQTNPALVPAYAGQPNPFPHEQKITTTEETEGDEEARAMLAQQELTQKMTSKIHQLIKNGTGLIPNLNFVKVLATTDGQAGPRMLLGNEWVPMGQTIQVPLMLSGQLEQALAQLNALSPAAANTERQKIYQDLQTQRNASLVITDINQKQVKLTYRGQQMVIPVSISNQF
jgi:hypothetical protein